LDEFVLENHEARIVNEVMDTMDLSPLLARYEGGGAPAYHPAMMLKVIIYAYRKKLEKVNVTYPGSRLMKDNRKVIQPCYNGQIAVDDKEQVIVAADENATDHAEFKPMIEQVERNLGNLPEEGSADAGYSSYDNLEYAKVKGLDLYMPDNFLEALDEKEENEKRYHKNNFEYDKGADTYICPEGKELKRWTEQKREGKPPLIIYRCESCNECPVREGCTMGEARTVSRDGREPLLEAMRQKLKKRGRKTDLCQAWIHSGAGFRRDKVDGRKPSMDLRGLLKMRGEFSLICLLHNVKKIVKKVLEGSVRLPGKYGKLIEAGVLGYREERRLTLVGAKV
jgi:transposase